MSVQARDLAVEFAYRFGRVPTVSRAPGRVNLIGEHTDYNDGFVMPAALEFATLTAASPRPDRRLRVYSMIMDETREFDLDSPREAGNADWSDYVIGVALMLEKSGRRLSGADLVIFTDVPIGSGLSSSAALEVSCSARAHHRGRSAVRRDRDRQALPARGERLCRHALRGDGSIYLLLRRRRACAPDRLPHSRLAQRRDRPELKASRRQQLGPPPACGRRVQRAARGLRGRGEAAQPPSRTDQGPARRDARTAFSAAPRAARAHLPPLSPYRHRECARARGGARA